MTRLDELRAHTRNGTDGVDQKIDGLLDLIAHAKPASVIEIGSDYGVSTEVFLLHCARVVAVDPWPDEAIYQSFIARCGGYPNLEIVRGRSPEALNAMPAATFDLCYIDGDHGYVSVNCDIVAGIPLVRNGGWMAGHDYNTFHAVSFNVRQFFGRPEMVFSDGSWIVRK